MTRVLALALAALALLGGVAQAQVGGAVAVGNLGAGLVTVDVDVVYGTEGCASGIACTDGRTVWLGVLAAGDRIVEAHELAHAVDIQLFGAGTRAALAAALGVAGRVWWGRDCAGHLCAAETFADAYALLAVKRRITVDWEYSAGSVLVTGAQVLRVGRLLTNRNRSGILGL